MTNAASEPAAPQRPAREAIGAWAAVIAALAVFKFALAPVLPFGGSITGALAVALFLWTPTYMARRHGREGEDDGLRFDRWGEDLVFALVVMAIVFPVFVAGFRAFLWAIHEGALPKDVARMLTGYGTPRPFEWRAPPDLLDKVAGNIAVALGEEFFYRGYMQRRFDVAFPAKTRLLGAPFGRGHLLQTALFAAGHLLRMNLYGLGTFFPGLLFTWMASRSGRVLAPAIVHAASNILIATLEASAFPR